MTKTGLANKELDVKKDIATRDRASREDIAKKDRRARLAGDAIKTAGKLLSPMATIVNDPKWYKRLPEMQDVVFNVPSYFPNSTPVNGDTLLDGEKGTKLPLVKTLYYDHTFESNVPIGSEFYDVFTGGLAENSPLNISAMRYKTELRKENSRVGEYEAGDIFQVTAGEIGVLEFIQYVKRAVLSMYTFNAYNPGLAKALVEAQGFSYEDLNIHLKDLQKWINLKISEVNTFLTIPADMTYALRKLFLVNTVYKEGTGDNAQYVQFVPVKFPLYDELESTLYFEPLYRITPLQPETGNREGITYTMILDIYNKMMGQFTNSTVLSTMIADIRGANIPFLKLGEYKYDEQLVLRPIDDVMIQIMNATICPWVGITNNGFRGRFNAADEDQYYDSDYNPLYQFNEEFHSTASKTVCYPKTKLSQDANGFLQFVSSFNLDDTAVHFHYAVLTGRTPAATFDFPKFDDSVMNKINKHIINCNVLNFYNAGKISDDMFLEATRLHNQWRLVLDKRYKDGAVLNFDSVLHLVGSTTEVILAEVTSYGPSSTCPNVFSMRGGYIGQSIYNTDFTNIVSFNYHPQTLMLAQYNTVANQYTQEEMIIPVSSTVLSQWDKVVKFTLADASPINDMCLRSLIYINPPKGFTR